MMKYLSLSMLAIVLAIVVIAVYLLEKQYVHALDWFVIGVSWLVIYIQDITLEIKDRYIAVLRDAHTREAVGRAWR